ncbi:class A beta-lactamase-related serine hydrolase [Nocardia panacis]|uniref:Class A beta-lactamase-related serine hydrolase n=1 Tax=Nocardia panacis TaxID=2340916 RepID=A0A3A4KCU7_9NOCA|nr:serine hydrolase domain-containing protein [Nocardia panacis]RJO70645.1 class A beta-lactamase-related serine hydrolase [Nocardia panacis]
MRTLPRTVARPLLAAVLAGSLVAAAACTDQDATTSAPSAARSEPTDRIDTTELQRDADAIRDVGVTGVQARLVRADGGNAVVTSGVADLAGKSPVPGDGYFRMASATKTFTATVVLQLVGDGKLALQDTVEKWLPGAIRGNGNDGTRITVRHLLNHTSGLADALNMGSRLPTPDAYRQHANDVETPGELVAAAVRNEPDFVPGAGWNYNNTGYLLLGMIIGKVTGKQWYEEVASRIIEPLALKGTSYPGGATTIPDPHAKAYVQWPTGGLIDTTENRLAELVGPAGALTTTTADLNTFFRALLGGKLLRPEQLAEMKRTVDTAEEIRAVWPGARYGLGLFSVELSCGGRYWMHGGDNAGYKTRDGVTDDGARSVVVSMSTMFQDGTQRPTDQENAALALVDHALCRR